MIRKLLLGAVAMTLLSSAAQAQSVIRGLGGEAQGVITAPDQTGVTRPAYTQGMSIWSATKGGFYDPLTDTIKTTSTAAPDYSSAAGSPNAAHVTTVQGCPTCTPQPTNLAQEGGVAPSLNAGLPDAGTRRVINALSSYVPLPAGSSASGVAIGPVQPQNYLLDTRGTFAGATATLKVAGADGVFVPLAARTAPGSVCVGITGPVGSTAANVQDVISGATGTPSLTSTLTPFPASCPVTNVTANVTPAWASSGLSAITGTGGTSAWTSASFTPAAGRPVDLDILFPAGVTCTVNLQRYETALATWFTTDTFAASYSGSFSSNETGRSWRLQSPGCTGGSVTYAMEH